MAFDADVGQASHNCHKRASKILRFKSPAGQEQTRVLGLFPPAVRFDAAVAGSANEAATDATDGCNFRWESNRLSVKKNRRFPDFLPPSVPFPRAAVEVTAAGKSAGRGSENRLVFPENWKRLT